MTYILRKRSRCRSLFLCSMLLMLAGKAPVSAQLMAQSNVRPQRAVQAPMISLVNALEKLKEQYRVDILFEERNIQNLMVPVNALRLQNNIEASLTELLQPLGLRYAKKKNNYIILSGENVSVAPAETPKPEMPQAKARNVTGKVTDKNGEGLPGVNIIIKGTQQGMSTDVKGEFSIDVPDDEATLVFSFVGYISQEMVIGNKSSIDVVLAVDEKSLKEVVVVGYGSRQKRDVTTSISTIASEEITKSVAMSPELAMQGRMTGVHISGNSGNPMTRPKVRIRGVGTWGVADPLYVVDGIPITELGGGIEGQDARIKDVRGPINIMTMIDPNDIESISVLKDASAAAIYGVRAANGVILITTKRGQTEKPMIEFNARYGVQNIVKKWDVMDTQSYTNFYKKSYAANPGFSLDAWFDPQSPGYLGNTKNTYDWQTPIINKNAVTQDYSVRVSGKTQATNYYLSAGYTSTEGTLIAEKLDRYSFNAKLDTKINNWLKTGINYRLAYVEGKDNMQSGLTSAAETSPWQPIYDPNGLPILQGFAQVVKGYNEQGVWSTDKLYGEGTRANSIAQTQFNTQDYNSIRNLGNTFVELTPIEGLSVKGSVSIDWYKHDRFSFNNYTGQYFVYAGSPTDKGGGKSLGSYEERYTTNFNLIKELTVNYHKAFGAHNFDLLLNGMDQRYSAKYVTASTDYMSTIEKHLFKLGGENQYTMVESELFRWSLQGLLGRVSYNYKNKYYVDATVRRDGSNRFAPKNRWGTFPSASVAWRITSEPFLENSKWLTDLKFRAGWGKLGNQEVRPLAYLSPVEKRSTYAFGSNPGGNGLGNYGVGAAMFSFPNADLGWEKITTTNIGFDGQFLGKLSFSAEYYDKRTDGILQETNIPPSVGSKENPVDNIASVRNSGFEVSANYNGSIGNLGYSVGANLTTVKNRVLSTFKGIPLNASDMRIEPGYSMNYIYGYQAGGIFQNQSQVDQYNGTTKDITITQTFQPGDRYFNDLNGAPDLSKGYEFYTPGADGTLNQYDRTYLGKTIPGYYYGFNLGLNYKGLDLSVFFLGVGDVKKYNYARATMEGTATRGNNRSVAVLNAWTPENPNTDIARAIVNDPNGSLRVSSYYVESAAYFKLGNAQLGYSFPKALLAPLKSISSLRMYMSVNNGFILTKWSGLDPENDDSPEPRVFNLGLSVKF